MSGQGTLTLARGQDWPTEPSLLAAGRAEARRILATGSKSFALAGLLLGRRARDDAAVLYAWCRRADDQVDEAPPGQAALGLARLAAELDDVYAGRVHGPLDVAMAELARRRRIPRAYLQALLDGFVMDCRGQRYGQLDQLDLYAFRVAGVVGLMMCHVLGVADARCLAAAARLGMAMQLTNIARDVAEDAGRGRQYLPTDLIAAPELAAVLRSRPADAAGRMRVARAVRVVLGRAEAYYRAGMEGLRDLDWRAALAVGAAARIYRAIGRILGRRGWDPLSGRAVVTLPRKLLLAVVSAVAVLAQLPGRWRRAATIVIPGQSVRWDDVRA